MSLLYWTVRGKEERERKRENSDRNAQKRRLNMVSKTFLLLLVLLGAVHEPIRTSVINWSKVHAHLKPMVTTFHALILLIISDDWGERTIGFNVNVHLNASQMREKWFMRWPMMKILDNPLLATTSNNIIVLNDTDLEGNVVRDKGNRISYKENLLTESIIGSSLTNNEE